MPLCDFTDAELAALPVPPQVLAMFLASLWGRRYCGEGAISMPVVTVRDDGVLFHV